MPSVVVAWTETGRPREWAVSTAAFREAGPRLVRVKGRLRFEPRHMAFREDPGGYCADCWSYAGPLFPVTGGFAAVSFPRDQAHNRAVVFDDMQFAMSW